MSLWNALGVALLASLAGFALSLVVRRVTVFEYQHAIRFTSGRFAGVLRPGASWVIRPFSTIVLLDARPRVIGLPGQEVLSSDGVSLKVSLLLHARVADPKAATLGAASYEQSLYAAAQEALRASIGERPIEEILRSRGELASVLKAAVEPAARELGVELEAISIKDIMFPGALKEAFSQAARARQEAQAALERARGETAALRNLANAARMMDGNPNLFQLRLLQAASGAGKVVVQLAAPDVRQANASREPTGELDT